MNKRQTIDEILKINLSAEPAFLARFEEGQLDEYLTHLQVLRQPRLSGERNRFERYFADCPAIEFVPHAGTQVEPVEQGELGPAPQAVPQPVGVAAAGQEAEAFAERPARAQGLLFST